MGAKVTVLGVQQETYSIEDSLSPIRIDGDGETKTIMDGRWCGRNYRDILTIEHFFRFESGREQKYWITFVREVVFVVVWETMRPGS